MTIFVLMAVLLWVAAGIGAVQGNYDDMPPSLLCLVSGWFSFIVWVSTL